MDIHGRVAVVTGGGGGIGGALSRQLAAAGAKVLVVDLNGERAAAVAAAIERDRPGTAVSTQADVADSDAIRSLLETAERALGPVDFYFANAGVVDGGDLASEAEWSMAIDVNLMAHVRAARALLPTWLERGEGYFVITASAAGLLTQIGLAPYAVTKHAAVGFAEWLAITYGSRGVRVSCVCPMGVDTDMHREGLEREGAERLGARVVAAAGPLLAPDEVARAALDAVDAERFMVLPHPEVLDYYRRKGEDYDHWITGMQRLQARVEAS